jgi:hypothetical protein
MPPSSTDLNVEICCHDPIEHVVEGNAFLCCKRREQFLLRRQYSGSDRQAQPIALIRQLQFSRTPVGLTDRAAYQAPFFQSVTNLADARSIYAERGSEGALIELRVIRQLHENGVEGRVESESIKDLQRETQIDLRQTAGEVAYLAMALRDGSGRQFLLRQWSPLLIIRVTDYFGMSIPVLDFRACRS